MATSDPAPTPSVLTQLAAVSAAAQEGLDAFGNFLRTVLGASDSEPEYELARLKIEAQAYLTAGPAAAKRAHGATDGK